LEKLKNALTNMIVHDLKGPLTAIHGTQTVLLEEMKRNKKWNDTHVELLINSSSACDVLLHQINGILDISKLEENRMPIHKTPTDLGDVIEKSIEQVHSMADKKGVRLIFKKPSRTQKVSIDPEIVKRVLINIMMNGIKFTDPGKEIQIRYSFPSSKQNCQVRISDSGIGIPKESLKKIFDKFFQVTHKESSIQGYGLGLAFCKLAVAAHKGEIWAESKPGKGSTFYIELSID